MAETSTPNRGNEGNDRAASLSATKQALLAAWAKSRGRDAADAIPRARYGDSAPTSFAQEMLWLVDQITPDGSAYNVPRALWLGGALDEPALGRALDAIVARHEVLRTTITSVDGSAVQIISPARPVELTTVDLSDLPSDTRERELRRLQIAEGSRRFDLSSDLMLRARLIRLADDEHVLLLTTHHIASDGWSGGVLYRELGSLYGAFSRGDSATLPTPAIQYADFAIWQRRRFAGDALNSQLEFWRQQLAGAPALLELPSDRPRPAVRSTQGARQFMDVPESCLDALRALSRREGVTLFVTLLATFEALLHRYTGRDDLIVGTPAAGRDREELHGSIGAFANTLVLRTDVSGDPTFRDSLARVRGVMIDALANQDVPFDRLVAELKPARTVGTNPIFQVFFALGVPTPEPDFGSLNTRRMKVERGTEKFDLTVGITERPDGLTASFEYSTDLFDEATIARMMDHYGRLLEAVADDPSCRISRLPLMSADERNRVLVEWNAPASADESLCVHELIRDCITSHAGEIAVVAEGESLTYAELDARATRLARRLQARGVGRGVPVGVCLRRSAELVVSLLAVLKAGGAYVPLDPDYPPQRLAWMLEDTNAPVVVTERSVLDALPATQAIALLVDECDDSDASLPELSDPGVRPDDLAYVLYTSGSTGRPKGVMVTHRAVVNFLQSMAREPGLGRDDVLLAVTTVSFDIAGLELFLPLTVGARVVIASRSVASDGTLLEAALVEHGVTTMQATPATWRMLIDSGWRRDENLKALCGGEAMGRDLAQRLAVRCRSVWNMYGPTETTIWSTLDRVDPENDETVLIGRPIVGTQIYILDVNGEPVPPGVAGELFIGGVGLARGYWRRQVLTAEKFLPDPFGTIPGGRIYRTGDLARWRSDGRIECLGRIDHQVKLRGFRIELGEIESALERRDDIRQAVADVREFGSGDQRLVAYFVAAEGAAPNPAELRQALAESLPHYMIPGAFVQLAALPRTPAGKIDRKALPMPDGVTSTARELTLPSSPLEEELCAIWGSVLGIGEIGIHDDFFELGGHSLLAAGLIARTRSALGVEVPTRFVFEAPTIAAMAERIERLLLQDADDDLMSDLLAELEESNDSPETEAAQAQRGAAS